MASPCFNALAATTRNNHADLYRLEVPEPRPYRLGHCVSTPGQARPAHKLGNEDQAWAWNVERRRG